MAGRLFGATRNISAGKPRSTMRSMRVWRGKASLVYKYATGHIIVRWKAVSLATTPLWKFEQLPMGDWCWDRRDADGSSRRMGTFRTLDACVADARDNGFREVLDERRMVPREPTPDAGSDQSGGRGNGSQPRR